MLQRTPSFALGIALGLSVGIPTASAAQTSVLSQTPLFVSESTPPMNMLVVAKDHKLYSPAYNDASDLDEDGVLDIYYKPSIDYTGYFNSHMCYSYANDVFTPVAATENKKCGSQKSARWSGDYLNYLTMSRIDVLRKVLYGGYRYSDTTTETVLERVFIPNDAHTWGKEYLSEARDGYKLTDYTPIDIPNNGKYVLFANTSRPATGTASIKSYTNGALPKLRVITSTAQGTSNFRIWGWVSREVDQGTNTLTSTSRVDVPLTPTDYTVRVKTCVAGLREANCTQYGNSYKPTGLLHEYGASDKMYFGLLTGSYTDNLRGGVVRKEPITSFTDEFRSQDGRFLTSNASNNNANRTYVNTNGIVANLDRLRYTNQCTDSYSTAFTNGDCNDWGNPLGEMTYETLRYYAGKAANANYLSSPTKQTVTDSTLGLTRVATWSNPYSSDNIKTCTVPFMTLVSDVNPSYDSDLPGSSLGADAKPASSDIGFNYATAGNDLWAREVGKSALINIGQSGDTNDQAPTAKTATSFATIRGLPEEPTRQGSYGTAAVTYFGSQNPITSSGSHPVQSFSVALSSTLPNIQIPVGNNTVTFKPYGMVTGTSGIIMQLTGFYMDTMANTTTGNTNITINGGRPYYKFRVVYDDAGQKADYDMDSIVLYTVQRTADNKVSITTETDYARSGSESHMGYTIAGTTKDGIYLEVSGGVGSTGGGANSPSTRFKFDTPPGRDPGYCMTNTASCAQLPGRSGNNVALVTGTSTTRLFEVSGTTNVTTLQNPMWYAAKYGKSDLTTWDTNGDGVPDNYFLVSNPAKLQAQLKSAFDDALQLNSSVTAPSVTSEASRDTNAADITYSYTTSFDVDGWAGDLRKVNTSTSELVWQASSTVTATNRKVLFAGANGSIASFTWSNLTEAQQALLNRTAAGATDTLGERRVSFLRGNSDSSFRRRSSLLGDIINSSPLLVTGADYDIARANNLENSTNYADFKRAQDQQPDVVYVGANDGMLHAFNTSNGAELFAFIPTAVIPNLPALTASDYGEEGGTEHQYYVDGSQVARDVYFGGNWHKVLLGSLGAGGKGIFALDITDPTEPSLLWEFNESDDADMGYSIPKPNIARLHNGKWVALVPNGYESGNNLKAVLFVLDIETGEILSKLEATPTLDEGESADGLGNGLSRVTDSDFNGDGIADYAYAGDLLGNLWRFDLLDTSADAPLTADASEGNFSVSFGGDPLYVARNADGERQPITAAPTLIKHPSNIGYLAIVGTGRYVTTTDKNSEAQQSLYGIWDRKTAGEAVNRSLSGNKERSDLTEQELGESTFNGATTFTLSSNNIEWYGSGTTGTADSDVDQWGWYLDFIQEGERLVYNMNLYGNTLILSTIKPDANACGAGVTGTVYGLNPRTGGSTRYATFDLDGDGVYDEGFSGFVTTGGDFSLHSGRVYVNKDGGTEDKRVYPGVSEGRQTWRQLTVEEE